MILLPSNAPDTDGTSLWSKAKSNHLRRNRTKTVATNEPFLFFLSFFFSLSLRPSISLFSLLRIGCHRHQDEFSWFPAAPTTFSPEREWVKKRCSFSSSHVMKFEMYVWVCASTSSVSHESTIINRHILVQWEERRSLAWPRVERCHKQRFISHCCLAFFLRNERDNWQFSSICSRSVIRGELQFSAVTICMCVCVFIYRSAYDITVRWPLTRVDGHCIFTQPRPSLFLAVTYGE